MRCITESLASFNSPVVPNANTPHQHSGGEKLCINQLIFEVYSLDSQRFKSFESTCLSSGRQKGKRLYLHCRCLTMQPCSCRNWPTWRCGLGRHICTWNTCVCMFIQPNVQCQNTIGSLRHVDTSMSSQGPDMLDLTPVLHGCSSKGEQQPTV